MNTILMQLTPFANTVPDMRVFEASGNLFGMAGAHAITEATFGTSDPLLEADDPFADIPPSPTVVLATGSTVREPYAELARQEPKRWQHVNFTHLDEYIFPQKHNPLCSDSSAFSTQLRRGILTSLFGAKPEDRSNIHLFDPKGRTADEIYKHNTFIHEGGGVTTMVLGLGRGPTLKELPGLRSLLDRLHSEYREGPVISSATRQALIKLLPSIHLAFNEIDHRHNADVFSPAGRAYLAALTADTSAKAYLNPKTVPFRMETYATRLHPSTIQANALHHLRIDHAMTMSLGAILCAKNIILLAQGAHKASALWLALMGPITPLIPASALQLAGARLTVVADEAALRYIPDQMIEPYSF